jgi:hypothetical protein
MPRITNTITVFSISTIALMTGCAIAYKHDGSLAKPINPLACSEKFSGPGARPVSPPTVANWYIKNGQLAYVVFLRRGPNWYDRHTDWHSGPDSTGGGFIQDFDVGGFRYSLVLDKDSHLLSVLGKTVDLAKGNVVLLDRSGDSAIVVGSEQHFFCWASPPNVVEEVLARSPLTTQFVGSMRTGDSMKHAEGATEIAGSG